VTRKGWKSNSYSYASILIVVTIACSLTGFAAALPLAVFTIDSSIPDAGTLLREVKAHQVQLEKEREDYTCRVTETKQERDSAGRIKKTETEERELIYVHGNPIERLVKRDGRELSAQEAKKEQDRVNREVIKDLHPGHNAADKDEITVARILEIIAFRNPRRAVLNGRTTIVFDFAGNPHAKTRGRSETALKKLSGTIWIDEKARQVARMSAILDDNYRIGAGLFASVAKGSNLTFDQAFIRNDAWLPTAIELHLQARAFLLVGIHDDISIRFDHYRKYQVDAVQLPGAAVKEK
jgi:hypothetical protein